MIHKDINIHQAKFLLCPLASSSSERFSLLRLIVTESATQHKRVIE
jgi:hypothetical protein